MSILSCVVEVVVAVVRRFVAFTRARIRVGQFSPKRPCATRALLVGGLILGASLPAIANPIATSISLPTTTNVNYN